MSGDGKNAPIDWPAASVADLSCHWYATRVVAVSSAGAARREPQAPRQRRAQASSRRSQLSGGLLGVQPATHSAATTRAEKVWAMQGHGLTPL